MSDTRIDARTAETKNTVRTEAGASHGGRLNSGSLKRAGSEAGCEVVEKVGGAFVNCGLPSVGKCPVVGNVCESHLMLSLIAGFKPKRTKPLNAPGERPLADSDARRS